MTKQQAIFKLMKSEKMFVVFSQRTKMPFVVCDPETMDDQIYVYFAEEEAKAEAQKLTDAGDICGVYVLSNKGFLPFYVDVYSMGVNCIVTGHNTESCHAIQLQDFVKRQIKDESKRDVRTIDNPSLHLTMLYFIQEISRKNPDMAAAKELEQEIAVHFQESTLLMPFQKDKKGILMEKNGHKFQPLFTDYFEYEKFDRQKKLVVIPVPTKILLKQFPQNAEGVMINPSSTNVLLKVAINREFEV